MAHKKHPQFIFAVSAGWFATHGFADGIHAYPIERFYQDVNTFLVIREREQLEKDGGYRQLLPYTIVTQSHEGVTRFLPYQRLGGGGEAKLHDKVSVGFGGHVDLASWVAQGTQVGSKAASTPNLQATLARNSAEELSEELQLESFGIRAPWTPHVVSSDLFIHQATDPEYLHIGLIQHAALPLDAQLLSGEADQIALLPLATAQEILDTYPNLESWTRVYLEYVAQRDAEVPALKAA